jgi:hypothetical protein
MQHMPLPQLVQGHVVHPIAATKSRQLPPEQYIRAGHTLPQRPQFAASVMSCAAVRHWPPQSIRPMAAHVVFMHAPSIQCAPAVVVQSVPHAPQWLFVCCRSVQTPPHDVRPGRHAHAPEMHAWSALHAWLHAPQLRGSVMRFVQVRKPPLHIVPAHAHVPETHVSPNGHIIPHEPQLAGSVETSMHAPPQATRPVGHTHAPNTHVSPIAHR